MNNQTIVYLMSGPAHLPYLLVSLLSLRQKYKGSVIVYAWPESYDIAKTICEDENLPDVVCRKWEPDYRKKNSQFICKQKVVLHLLREFEKVIYLDADTLINDSLLGLFNMLDHYEFVATQFNDWTSAGIVKGRIQRLKDIPGIPQDLLHKALTEEKPSVNGGVFGCRDSNILEQWNEWSFAARSIFISDETAMHLLAFKYEAERYGIANPGWNVSPKYFAKMKGDWHPKDVKIWHFHGDSNVRPNKSEYGVSMWYPLYKHFCKQNFGKVQEWKHQINNKWLSELERTYVSSN